MAARKTVEFIWREPVYDSLSDSVVTLSSSARFRQATVDNEALAGLVIVGHALGRSSVTFLLSNGTGLRIELRGDIVSWRLDPTPSGTLADASPAAKVELVFDDGDQILWCPEDLLLRLHGRSGITVNPRATVLYLQAQGCTDTLFSQMIDTTTKERFVFFEEGDA